MEKAGIRINLPRRSVGWKINIEKRWANEIMKHEIVKSVFLCFMACCFAGCGASEAQNAFPANTSKVSPVPTASNASNVKNSSNENSSDVSPLPLAVKLPTKKELQTKGGKLTVLKAYLTGAWEKTDSIKGCRNIWIEFPSSDFLCVEGNNIYIEAFYKLNRRKQKVYVYLKKTKDLSDAAILTPWKDIDKSKPIAVIDVSKALSTGLIDVKWIGFVNKKTGEIYDYGKDDHDGLHRKQLSNE